MKKVHVVIASFVLAVFAIQGCKKDSVEDVANPLSSGTSISDRISESGQNPDETVFEKSTSANRYGIGGYVYTESNDLIQNSILVISKAQADIYCFNQQSQQEELD